MIVYDLQCANEHRFEGWFEDDAAYTDQRRNGLLTCPVCSDANVHRIPSTFAIRSSGNGKPEPVSIKFDPKRIVQKIQTFVEEHFDNVGTDFAREALKIHYGASEPRNIRGTSTDEEEKCLREEGIEFIKVPLPITGETDS